MRPLRLRVEGLTSFREPAEVDFTGLSLFAITGATGAGKSSLIDAMLLALFGRAPRVGREHNQLISHGMDRLSVLLEFRAGGRHYRIARSIRSDRPSQVQLERVDGDVAESLAGKAREVELEIQRILGMDYDAFTRSVVLPQGQFDAFLSGDPKQRREILVGLLDLSLYERIARLAGDRQRQQEAALQSLQQRLAEDFAEATPERLAEVEQALAASRQQEQDLERRTAALAACGERAQAVRVARAEGRRLADEAAGVGKQLADAQADHKTRAEAQASFAGRQQELTGQLQAVAVDPERRQALAQAAPLAASLVRAHASLRRLVAEAAAGTARADQIRQALAQAEAALPQLATTVQERQQDLAAAEAALQRQQQEHAAAHLRAGLTAGAECPVCGQAVARLPAAAARPGDDAQAAVATARAELRAAEKLRDDVERQRKAVSQRELPEAERAAAAAAERRQAAEAELTELRQGLQECGIDPGDPAAAEVLQQRITAEARALQERAQQQARIQRQLDDLRAEHERSALALAAADKQVELLGARQRELAGLGQRAAAALTDAERALAAAAAAAGLSSPAAPRRAGDPDEAAAVAAEQERTAAELRQAHGQSARLQEAVVGLRAGIEKAGRLREQATALARAVALTRELARLLRGDRFRDFVLEEAVRQLTRQGSARLEMLSQGRYSLRSEGTDFQVVDHWNADRARSVKTLSGGETFLASLALSLALAENFAGMAADDRAGTLQECLFIDEGFGALDREALELAVQALEELQGGQRLVGVVTHLEALAESLPARLRVENTGGAARIVVA